MPMPTPTDQPAPPASSARRRSSTRGPAARRQPDGPQRSAPATLVLAGLLPVLGACAATAATTATPDAAAAVRLVTVARALGSRQCDSHVPSPTAATAALRDAGIAVQALACGRDGRLHPALCGVPDGRLVFADIPTDRLADAQALGFRPMSAWPDAQRVDCAPDTPPPGTPAGPASR